MRGASAKPLSVGSQRSSLVSRGSADLPHAVSKQVELLPEGRSTAGWNDLEQILQGRRKAPGHLRRARTGEADLVEAEMDVVVPVHGGHRDSEVSPLVAVPAVRDHADAELA